MNTIPIKFNYIYNILSKEEVRYARIYYSNSLGISFFRVSPMKEMLIRIELYDGEH